MIDRDYSRREIVPCDLCGHPRVSEVAETIVPPGVMVNSRWVGTATPEKAEAWRAALREATSRLSKPCFVFATCDGDGGSLCEDCFRAVMSTVVTDTSPSR